MKSIRDHLGRNMLLGRRSHRNRGKLRKQTRGRLLGEQLEHRTLLAVDSVTTGEIESPWQNISDPLDVNADGWIVPQDALMVINALNKDGSHSLASEVAPQAISTDSLVPNSYIDVNGDQFLSPMDALIIINNLNAQATAPAVQIRLQVSDLLGNPITEADVGSEILVQAFVSDLRDPAEASGVFAAYFDLLYSSELVSVNGALSYGSDYQNGKSGDTTTTGIVDELGAFAGFDELGSGEFLVASVPMLASTPGTASFTGDPADVLPDHDVLLFNPPTSVALQDIFFVSDELIINGISLPEASISDVEVAEGDSGTTLATFTVTLTQASDSAISIDFTTEEGFASANVDYNAISGTINFQPGETTQTISVEVVGDTIDELDETFQVVLSNADGAVVTDDTGVATILDDDAAAMLSIADVSVPEGDAGTTTATFVVTLSTASEKTIVVDFDTSYNTAEETIDLLPASGTLTFAPGETSKTIDVLINGDTDVEEDETYFINLLSPNNATLADGQAIGTIENDDVALPTGQAGIGLQITDTQGNPISSIDVGGTFVLQGIVEDLRDNAEGVFGAYFDVLYTSGLVSTTGPITFAPEYGNGKSGDLSSPGEIDEVGAFDGTTPLGPEARQLFSIEFTANAVGTAQFAGNPADEVGNEVLLFGIDLPIPEENLIFTDAQLTIIQPTVTTLSIGDVTVSEGDGVANFLVSLSQPSDSDVTFDFLASDGTAIAGDDYEATSGSTTIAAGKTSVMVSVPIIDDMTEEETENFQLSVSNVSGAVLGDGVGIGTITDDDITPSLSIDDISVVEGDEGITQAIFTVTLSQSQTSETTVVFETEGNTAIANIDFMGDSGMLTFAAGDTTQQISINVFGDTLIEGDEMYFVKLSQPSGATIAKDTGLGIILNDDFPPTISINDVSKLEGDNGTTQFEFTVLLSKSSDSTVTVDFATEDSTAIAGSDYEAANGQITFEPGETSKTIVVHVIGDVDFETDETFNVRLSNSDGATIDDDVGLGTILNDDQGTAQASLSGFTFFDFDNDGVRDANEDEIEQVMVTLIGTDDSGQAVMQVTETNEDGFYRFDNLAGGNYSLVQTQPAFFIDGIDRIQVEGSPGTAQNDQFVDIVLSGQESFTGYDFGERALKPQFQSKADFLASEPREDVLRNVSFFKEGIWHSFDDGFDGTMTAQAFAPSGTVELTLLDENMNILATTGAVPGNAELQFQGTRGTVYFLRVRGADPSIELNIITSAITEDSLVDSVFEEGDF